MSLTSGKDREIGFLVAITNIRVTVELHSEIKSAVRSYPGGLSTVAQIGAYLMFPLGAGEWAVGVIVAAFENESYEPDPGEGMTLQLAKPRRTLRVNLLGTLYTESGDPKVNDGKGQLRFRRGVHIYPTLDTPAIIPTEDDLQAILTDVVYWKETQNKPYTLPIGQSPIYPRVEIHADYDDIFARPLAIVGNTGSGKSWTVASLLQRAFKNVDQKTTFSGAKVIILDINGEYWRAFRLSQLKRKPDEAYINNEPFSLPLWCLNLKELIHVFQVTEATQAQLPVLERMITFARRYSSLGAKADELYGCLSLLLRVRNDAQTLRDMTLQGSKAWTGKNAKQLIDRINKDVKALRERNLTTDKIPSEFSDLICTVKLVSEDGASVLLHCDVETIGKLSSATDVHLSSVDSEIVLSCGMVEATADTPLPFDHCLLADDKTRRWVLLGFENEADIRRHLPTLFLRIHRWMLDSRWNPLKGKSSADIENIVRTLVGELPNSKANVIIIDCSMIAYDVLPFFCACVGRLLLDARRHAAHEQRTLQPWVLVLEEAHNYLRPYRAEEDLGVALSRESFERVAKEGRKFGLSLIIASQRPRDVSDTVLSQCANFIIHRIQNPDDIEYFRRIVPVGSREMLDQVPILDAGDALLLGSAVNVPSRVHIAKPDPPPQSETPKPSKAWLTGEPLFDIAEASKNWLSGTISDMETTQASAETIETKTEEDKGK